MSETLIKVEGVSKKFCRSLKKSLWYGMQDLGREITGRQHGGNGHLRPDEFWAVKDVSFELKRGECLGLIGHNGAGKTTLLKILNGLIKPDSGRVEMRGRIGALIALGAGFNPILTGRENIYINASVLGLSKREIDEKMEEIIDFAEIGEFIDMPVQSYSSGMSVRLGFSIASSIAPDILILDEVLAVGDSNFQTKCMQRIGKMSAKSAVILVSHQAHHIQKICDKAMLLNRGNVTEIGEKTIVMARYQSEQQFNIKQPTMISGGDLEKVDVELLTPRICHGDFLEFEVKIVSRNFFRCDQSYLNLIDSTDNVHAQSVLNCLVGNYECGLNVKRVKVGPLHLSSGRFAASIQMYGENGKATILAFRRCIEFDVFGQNNLGPSYYPPSFLA